MTDRPSFLDAEPLKPAVRRRLEFIDFRLFWTGRFNRSDLAEVFQISPQQASADIAAYEQRAGQNLHYDNALKAYVRTEQFEPVYVKDFSDRYLLQLVGLQSGWIRKEDTWFDSLPPSDVVALKKRRTDSKILQQVIDGIREKLELQVMYRAITSGTATRWIAPHALAYSTGHWYIRAWSRERNDFRDFSINRIVGVSAARPVRIPTELDYEWHTHFDLVLEPNPSLDEETRRAVADDYEMTDGKIVESLRLSLVFYLMSEHNLDVAPGTLNPKKQQLVLTNREEVEAARSVARKMSSDALKKAIKT